ncbi:hypothetical protein [Malacoplasma iowae]|uniref:hypothetical protein n=1 Tax=Malacoplasma iowae TaxID=2116 RepID=UPI002A18A644|nr:hypothetical protein [Malacoplasma iowae]WPL36982.1 hypothetical protein QX179_00650 [Malacoplasma iowae]WPL38170.1 hypothetical protein QX182_01420 [Malacoplasma iowae]WPL40539.1 hypothetical protein QX184_03270 [Malacoplasma iowae]
MKKYKAYNKEKLNDNKITNNIMFIKKTKNALIIKIPNERNIYFLLNLHMKSLSSNSLNKDLKKSQYNFGPKIGIQ